MNVLILGPQGAGKGTQAARIASEYGARHLSTGDLFRAAIASGTELGQKVKPLLDSGQLVPDEVTVALIREQLAETDGGWILDGFPRNLAQAEALDAMLTDVGQPLDVIVLLEIGDDVGRERMLKRAQTEGRADDTPEVIERRLATYHEQTEPVVQFYLASGKLVQVHGERTVDEVWAEIQQALDEVDRRSEDAA